MAIPQISAQNLGKFLQIAFDNGIRNQLSEDYRDWEFIKRARVGDPNGREKRFYLSTSYGPSAIQWMPIAAPGDYPAASQLTGSEYSAVYKEIAATIELQYNLWNRARKSPAKYAEPLAEEIKQKSIASHRRLSIDLYGSGTGVLGEVADVSASVDFATDGTKVAITLDSADTSRGFVGWFEFGDIIQFYSTAGAEHALVDGATSAAYGIVVDKDRVNNKAIVSFYDASDNLLTIDGLGTVVDTDVLYRKPQPTKADLTSIGSTDYNTLTEVMAGLDSLVANDGRTVHGMTMEGAIAGSVYDAGAAPLDSSHLQRSLSQCKTRVGAGRYSYKSMLMAPEANDVLVESRETDRRFQSVQDSKRGTTVFAYVHNNDTVEVVSSEFCPKNRIYMMPESKQQDKVMEFNGTDFELVDPNGNSPIHLKPSANGGHSRFINQYLEAMAVLVCKHPAAINVIKNFTV